jgi:hypothetical protein
MKVDIKNIDNGKKPTVGFWKAACLAVPISAAVLAVNVSMMKKLEAQRHARIMADMNCEKIIQTKTNGSTLRISKLNPKAKEMLKKEYCKNIYRELENEIGNFEK